MNSVRRSDVLSWRYSTARAVITAEAVESYGNRITVDLFLFADRTSHAVFSQKLSNQPKMGERANDWPFARSKSDRPYYRVTTIVLVTCSVPETS
jgi:hypothetical protein